MAVLIPKNECAPAWVKGGGADFVSMPKLTLRKDGQDDPLYHEANARRKLR